jgi:pimeloyl-ACP methyl ester carboxylesterase
MRDAVVFIPGLGDHARTVRLLTFHWKLYGLTPVVHAIGWDNELFKERFDRLRTRIRGLLHAGNRVSVVGVSAGASAALNAFISMPEIHRAVALCGCVRYPAGRVRAWESAAFRDSITLLAENDRKLTERGRANIMALSAAFGDERVANDLSVLPGAKNISLPCGGHAITIGLALTLFSPLLVSFIKATDVSVLHTYNPWGG